MFPLCRCIARHLTIATAVILLPAAALAAQNPLPSARATGIGIMTLAYGPQRPLAPTIALNSQTVVTSDSATTVALHTNNPGLTVLAYINPNLAYYYRWYTETQNTETAFLHAGDPAFLGAVSAAGQVTLTWLSDSRGALGFFSVAGYNVYRRKGSTGSWQLIATPGASVTSYIDSGLQNGQAYTYRVATVDGAGIEHAYSNTLQAQPGTSTVSALVVSNVTVTQPDTVSALTTITVAASPSINALDLWFDVNRTRTYDASERFAMTKGAVDANGLQLWSASVTTSEPKQIWGIAGHQWYVQTASGAAAVVRTPQTGYNSSNPNNRVRAYDWGTWMMDLSDTTWVRIVSNAAQGLLDDGADGLFIDVGVSSPLLLFPDSAPLKTQIAHYRDDMKAFMATLKGVAGTGAVLFNGLDTSTLTYLDVTDGAMMEGFIAQTWQPGGSIGGIWWSNILDAELRAQAGRSTTIFNYGVGMDSTITARMYALASHLLVSNDHSFYYYGYWSPAYYPEFDLTIGAPTQSFSRVAEAKRPSGLYGRTFSGGMVLVNPSDTDTLRETLSAPLYQVTPSGGMITSYGGNGALSAQLVSTVVLPPHGGAVLLNSWSGAIGMPAFAPGSAPVTAEPTTLALHFGPNPARQSIAVHASLPQAGTVHAVLYDAGGRAVAEIARHSVAAGAWDAAIDVREHRLASGVYLLRLETLGTVTTRRFVVARTD